jgi:BASS family bile acid:Na+ symporter
VADLPRPARRLIPALHEALVPLVLLAAVLGIGLPGAANWLRPAVPAMLAGQVAGVALTITGRQFRPVLARPVPIAVALSVQWLLFPLFGYLLLRASGADLAGQGAFIVAVAPAEITSALVAVLAGGTAATATVLMTASVATGCVLTPLWLTLLGRHSGSFNHWSIVFELVVSVALPLIVGVAIRTRSAAVARHPRRCLDAAGISLLLVVFVGAGAARPLLLSSQIAQALLLAVALVVFGGVLGTVVAWAMGRTRSIGLALAFPIGMREFGIATAVALSIAPGAAGFGGLYGIIMMISAAGVAFLAGPRKSARGAGAA